MSTARVEIEGLGPLLRALRDDAGLADVMRKALRNIGVHQDEQSKLAAPSQAGKLRGSIMYEVDKSPMPLFVRVGTIGNDAPAYAAYMEFGTGTQHDHPNWPRRVHRPFVGRNPRNGPVAGLVKWAAAKGRGSRPLMASAASIAWAIMQRGGLEPRRYLRGPFERNQARYVAEIRTALGRLTLRG